MLTFAPAKQTLDALVAQLVEHLTLNQGVQGSIPCRRTKGMGQAILFCYIRIFCYIIFYLFIRLQTCYIIFYLLYKITERRKNAPSQFDGAVVL